MKVKFVYCLLLFVLGLITAILPTNASADTVTYTVSWQTEPANVEVYKIEKQVQAAGNANAPWTPMPDVPAGTKQFVDVGNTVGVNTCFRVTPTNSKPSTGTPQVACSLLIPSVGPMTTITVLPALVTP